MVNVHAFNAVDAFLKDLCNTDEIFGGKVVILSGDFRQILPIMPKGKKNDILNLCVKSSPIWTNFKKYQLQENMRVQEDECAGDFKRWLLQIGEGKYNNKFESENELVCIPNEMIVNSNIVDEIYGKTITKNDITVYGKAILAPRNVDVLETNEKILDKLEGQLYHCFSIDTLNESNENMNNEYIPQEYLNSLTPNGMPPHDLKLKIGAIVILLRNMNIREGLCNGTRLKVIDIKKYLLYAEIISGAQAGNRVFLPRIDLEPSQEELPFSFRRRQFAVRIGYAMTINKGQGQSFDSVGIYLTTPVFSHGQLYVAVSRAKKRHLVKIQMAEEATFKHPAKKKGEKTTEELNIYTKNIVYQEVMN